MTELAFPVFPAPDVSVVMVTYGGGELPLRALNHLRQHTDVPYEVIVVDNASPDGTGERLRDAVEGATIVLNEENYGFAAACNQGAVRAVGRSLCFLNPDAFVEEGWLPPLVARLVGEPDVGCVVPRLLNLDGTLQEAGSLIGREGVTWALGNGDDAADLEFRFPLDVDFGSAACMVVRRVAFEEVGGFDVTYRPAYGEDADLCLALSDHGWRTVLEPAVAVRHVRSGMSDVHTADRLIRKNRHRLLRRWTSRLAGRSWLQEPAYFPHRIAAVRDHGTLDRILVIGERLGQELADLAERLRATVPAARVTIVVDEAGEVGERLAGAGVEVVAGPRDWSSWFEGRRYQASVVLAAMDRFDALLDETQPQAARRALAGPPADLQTLLAETGVAP